MKKAYIQPDMQMSTPMSEIYMAGDNSIPSGGTGGPGTAEGKERKEEESDNGWGSLW